MSEEESYDVDVIELYFDDEEIDEMIEKLKELKESKGHFHFEVDDENELLVHYVDDELGNLGNDETGDEE